MKIEQVAAQLYTVRDFTKTPADIAETLKKVREIGYQAIQASALGPIEDAELVRLCEENELTLCATHEPGDQILNNPEAVVQKLKNLNCTHTAYPYPRDIDFDSTEAVNDLIAKLDRAGEVLKAAGLVLSYHNHHLEFRKLSGQVILEKIFEETERENLAFELDTYWIQYGGSDPVSWCKKAAGRMPCLHLKDFRINSKNEIEYAEVGAGNLDFKAIVAAAEDGGCEWYIVEQDTCPGDPFDSLAQSFAYIRDNLCD